MLKSCKYCGRVHDEKVICHAKSKRLEEIRIKEFSKDRHNKEYTEIIRTNKWTKTSREVKERDNYMCLICKEDGIIKKCDSVHHIEKVLKNKNKAYSNNNLISLCNEHHIAAEKGDYTIDYLKRLVKKSTLNKLKSLNG